MREPMKGLLIREETMEELTVIYERTEEGRDKIFL